MSCIRIFAFMTLICVLASACGSSQPLLSKAAYPINGSARIQDWTTLQRERVVMQQYDYTCGAAAMATMLRYYFNDAVSELDVLSDIDQLYTADQLSVIKDQGLSFIELEQLAKHRGYQSASVQLEPEVARSLQGPIIIYLRTNEYQHFAVLRRVIGDTAFVADPSLGNVVLPFTQLLQDWHGEALVLGKDGFGVPAEFALRPIVVANRLNDRRLLERRTTNSDWSRLPK